MVPAADRGKMNYKRYRPTRASDGFLPPTARQNHRHQGCGCRPATQNNRGHADSILDKQVEYGSVKPDVRFFVSWAQVFSRLVMSQQADLPEVRESTIVQSDQPHRA